MQGIDRPIGVVLAWAQFLFHPITSTQALLESDVTVAFSKKLLSIWTLTILVHTIISMPVLYYFGIGVKDIDFFIVFQSTLVAAQAFAAFVTHRMLLFFKQRSHFPETIKLFSVQFIYYPVISILQLPNTYLLYSQISWIKSSGLGFMEIPQNPTLLGNNLASKLDGIAGVGYSILGSIIMAVFAECLIQWYSNDRFRTYLAVGAGFLVAIGPILLLIVPVILMNVYVHIR